MYVCVYVYIYIYTHTHFVCLDGISTIAGYLMPNLVYTYKMIYKHKSTKLNGSKFCCVSLTIQFNISHLFTHI